MEGLEAEVALPFAGLAAGTLLGYVARINRFCTLGALERFWHAGDATGLRTWILAATIALAATQTMVFTGVVDLSETFYLNANFGLGAAIFGGVLFGLGMSLVGTCAFGALVRLGGGSLRSLVILAALGLSALATQRGILGPGRKMFFDATAVDLSFAGDQSMGSLVSAVVGLDVRLPLAIIVTLALLGWIFSDPEYRRNTAQAATGVIIGLIIAFGWLATSMAAEQSFSPVQIEAGSFVAPMGDLILQVITYTGVLPDYGVGLIVGVIFGAVLGAWKKHDSRWEACDDARELSRHLLGGAMMGIGGIFALGCTIGQGVTAFSTLAVSAPIVFASIVLGARLGLSWLLEGSIRSAFRRTGPGRATNL